METSLKLSKKLKENWFEGEYKYVWAKFKRRKDYNSGGDTYVKNRCKWKLVSSTSIPGRDKTPAYDILNDLCVKYAKEMFGERREEAMGFGAINYIEGYETHTANVLYFLQQDKQQEAEDYLWENCLFNPKNK